MLRNIIQTAPPRCVNCEEEGIGSPIMYVVAFFQMGHERHSMAEWRTIFEKEPHDKPQTAWDPVDAAANQNG